MDRGRLVVFVLAGGRLESRTPWPAIRALVLLGVLGFGAGCGSRGPSPGTLGGHCFPDKTCNGALSCFSNLCVDAGAPSGAAGSSFGSAGAGGNGGAGTTGMAGTGAPDAGATIPACTLGSAIIGECAL
jgi:hypothetical protein